MLQKLIMAGAFAGLLASVPIFYQSDPQKWERLVFGEATGQAEEPAAPLLARTQPVEDQQPARGRSVRIDADARGHFSADFRLNGRPVPALIDTGATVVAINRSTARRIGLQLSASDFTATVETANGRTKAAHVTIDRFQLGRIEMRDVRAVVLEDGALANALVGMSFLSRLKRYQVERGALLMEQ